MQALEFAIMIGIAIIVGFFIVGFLSDWEFLKLGKSIRHEMLGEEEGIVRVNSARFSTEAAGFAKACRESGNMEAKSYFVLGNSSFSKADMFNNLISLGWCEHVQSNASGCGTREDLDMASFQLPKVVRLSCLNGSTQVR
jgi:hypothetical protein